MNLNRVLILLLDLVLLLFFLAKKGNHTKPPSPPKSPSEWVHLLYSFGSPLLIYSELRLVESGGILYHIKYDRIAAYRSLGLGYSGFSEKVIGYAWKPA